MGVGRGEVLIQSHGLITKSGHCCPTGLPASNTRHHPSESERKDPSSAQLSSVPMKSQMEELTTRCSLPLFLKRVMLHGWRCPDRQRDHIAPPVTSICSEGWSCRVLGSKPAIQWPAIRGQRDPTVTKDLMVSRKALSCVGY